MNVAIRLRLASVNDIARSRVPFGVGDASDAKMSILVCISPLFYMIIPMIFTYIVTGKFIQCVVKLLVQFIDHESLDVYLEAGNELRSSSHSCHT